MILGVEKTGAGPGILAILFLLGVAAAALCFVLRRKKHSATRVVPMLLFAYLPGFLGISLWRPTDSRYVLALMPGVALLVASVPAMLGDVLRQDMSQDQGRGGSARIHGFLPTQWYGSAHIALILAFIYYAGVGPVSAPGQKPYLSFDMGDVESISTYLAREGWTYPEVFRHLRGGIDFVPVGSGLSAYLPRSPSEWGEPEKRRVAADIAVFKSQSGDIAEPLPSGWRIIPRAGSTPALLYQYSPYLRWDSFAFCYRQWGDLSPCQWHEASYRFESNLDPRDRHFWFVRAFAGIHVPAMANIPGPPYSMIIRIPVRVPAGMPPRSILMPVPESWQPEYCPGAILSVSGVDFQGRLPANSVTLLSRKKDTEGHITFWWDLCTDKCREGHDVFPPSVLEFDRDSLSLYRGKIMAPEGASPSQLSFGGSGDPQRLRKIVEGSRVGSQDARPASAPAPLARAVAEPRPVFAPRALLAPRWYAFAALLLSVVGLGIALAICLGFRLASGPED
jgi:hypothetical protein